MYVVQCRTRGEKSMVILRGASASLLANQTV